MKKIVITGIAIFLMVSICFSLFAHADSMYEKFDFVLGVHDIESKSLYSLAEDKESRFNVSSSIPVHVYIMTSDAYHDIWLSSPYDKDDFSINTLEKKNITDISFTWTLSDDQSYYLVIFNPNDINATVSYSYQKTLYGEISKNFGEAFAGLIGGICAGTMCFIGSVFYFFISLIIAYWMLKDADKRGRNGVIWFIIGLLLGIIGLIIWFIIRPKTYKEKTEKKEVNRTCPNCGRNIPEDARTCPYCSKKFW